MSMTRDALDHAFAGNDPTRHANKGAPPRVDITNAIDGADLEAITALLDAAAAAVLREDGADPYRSNDKGYASLARRLGVNAGTLSRYAKGHRRMDYPMQVTLRLIAYNGT